MPGSLAEAAETVTFTVAYWKSILFRTLRYRRERDAARYEAAQLRKERDVAREYIDRMIPEPKRMVVS